MNADNADRSLILFYAGRASANDVLEAVVADLHSTPEPHFDLISTLGVGPLESLFHHGEEEALWPRIEQLARDDLRFRRALSAAWAFDSPMFDRREALLHELGEYRTVTVRFVIQPRTFDDGDGFSWRAYEVDGMALRPHLGPILRAIAARADAPEPVEPKDPPRPPRELKRSSDP